MHKCSGTIDTIYIFLNQFGLLALSLIGATIIKVIYLQDFEKIATATCVGYGTQPVDNQRKRNQWHFAHSLGIIVNKYIEEARLEWQKAKKQGILIKA